MARTDASAATEPWWRDAVFYQIYPRSFASSNAGSVGDLAGITSRLDYVQWLGVDALWVSPFYESPMADFGYDVSDYCAVDPMFGSLADFDELLASAHARGLKVMIDWVPSHTSQEHRWFKAARANPGGPEREFYVFADPAAGGGPPNNWTCTFGAGASAWARESDSGQYYLHSFLPEQPDLNWHSDALAQRMYDTLRFWLDRGVDGFRVDVVHNMCKDASLADVDPALAALPHMLFNDEPGTHARLREMRRLLDGYPGDRTMVGEVFLLDTEKVASYYGDQDELHMAFNFPPLYAEWSAESWRECIRGTEAAMGAKGAWPTWVLSNHDQKRHRTRYGGDEARARAACVLLLTQRGTPFIYQGEELGLEDALVSEAQAVDPGKRDGSRAPIPWTQDAGQGWAATPWLPLPPQSATRNVASQRADASAIIHLYRRLLELRRALPVLRRGAVRLREAPDGVLAYERVHGESACTVLVNFTDEPVAIEALRELRVALRSDDASAHPTTELFDGRLGASQAVVLIAS